MLQAYLRLSRAESTGVPSLARCLGRSAARGNFSSLCQGWHAPQSRSAGIRCGIGAGTAVVAMVDSFQAKALQGVVEKLQECIGGYVAALRFYTKLIGVLVVRASAKRKHKIQALYLEAARNGVPAKTKFYGGFKVEHSAMPDRINPHRWRLPQQIVLCVAMRSCQPQVEHSQADSDRRHSKGRQASDAASAGMLQPCGFIGVLVVHVARLPVNFTGNLEPTLQGSAMRPRSSAITPATNSRKLC